MWKPYLAVIAEKAGSAVNILDRFHIMSHMSKAIDEVRADETKELKKNGKEPLLTKSRCNIGKRPGRNGSTPSVKEFGQWGNGTLGEDFQAVAEIIPK